MDEEWHDYFFTIPSDATNEDAIYVTVETYSSDIIPEECVTGEAADDWGEVVNPVV